MTMAIFKPIGPLLLIVALAAPALGQTKTAKAPEAAPSVVKFPLESEPYLFQIKKVNPDGNLDVKLSEMGPGGGGPRGLPGLTEGYYLGITTKDQRLQSLVGAMASLAQVVRVDDDGAAVVRVGAAAAKELTSEHLLVMIRPVRSTTAAMKAIPIYAPIEDDTAVPGGPNADDRAKYAITINNLRQIGLALHNYHDVHNGFPPAVVYGPDGKPWHSWRVLILPFVEQAVLFEKYKMDEPWDSPHNKKLCDIDMPMYQAPVFGATSARFTHFVAAAGVDTALNVGKDKSKRLRIRDVTDGLSNTAVVGLVDPETKIPWSKPQDLAVDAKLPPIGKPGGLASPFKSPEGPATPLLFADGSVRSVSASIKHEVFRRLLSIADGEPLLEEDIPLANVGVGGRRAGAPEIHVVRTADGVKVRLVTAGQ